MAYDKVVDSGVLDGKLTAIADAIRGKTGGTDALTLEQMAAAIGGISGGGGLTYDMGEFVLDAECQLLETEKSQIYHGLGEVPQFVLIWTDDFKNLNVDNVSPYTNTTMAGYAWFDNLFQLLQRVTAAATASVPLWVGFNLSANDYRIAATAGSSLAYNMKEGEKPTAEKLGLSRTGNNNFWRTGITYKYFVSKAWWEVAE